MEPLDDCVNLDPQARGQDDGLRDVRTSNQLTERLAHVVLSDGYPLEDCELSISLMHSDNYDGHLPLPFPHRGLAAPDAALSALTWPDLAGDPPGSYRPQSGTVTRDRPGATRGGFGVGLVEGKHL